MSPEHQSRLSSICPQTLRLAGLGLGLLAGLAPTVRTQVAWVPVPTSKAPSARSRAGMAYDFLRQRIVLFGGQGGQSRLSDTWEYDGAAWKQIFTAKSPPARSDFAMTYDRGRGVVVLNGGFRDGNSNSDTWEYDGVNWTERQFTVNPPDLGAHAMVYDAGTGAIVLFGGIHFFGVSDETWSYNGHSWTKLSPAVSPSARMQPVLVHDPIRNRIVMHGGTVSGFPQFDTYEFNGTTWALTTRASQNPARDLPAYCFDGHRGRLVLFGGQSPTTMMQDTHEYDSPKWTPRTPVGPVARMGAAMAYDSVRRECIMFGGETNFGQTFFADTYRYTTLQPANATKFGAGCAGTWSTPALSTFGYDLPYIASTMRLYLTALPANAPTLLWLGASKTTFGPIALPFSLQPMGMPGCNLLASPTLFLSVPTSGHYGTLPMPVPNDPSLAGGTLFAQAFILDPGANAGNGIVTQGLELEVGQK